MTPYYDNQGVTLYLADARRIPLPDACVQTCVTSPPYFGLRDYGTAGQIGLEDTPEQYVAVMVEVFREVRRVLKPDGTLWLNLGDSYAGSWWAQSRGNWTPGTLEGASDRETCLSARQIKAHPKGTHTGSRKNTPGLKAKDLIGIPWRVAFALQADGWWLRSDIIWAKPNPMPESIEDRPTKSHEYLFLLSKSERYAYDADAIKEPCESGPSDIRKMVEGQDRIGGKHKDLVDPLSRASSTTRLGQKRAVGSPDGRNCRSVWNISTTPYPGAHFATFPKALPERCILAGSKPDDLVLDCFNGSGTTGEVARKWGRRYVGLDLNAGYLELSKRRFAQGVLFGTEGAA